jgi:hypothetical protein
MAGFIRRFGYFPGTEQITQIEGVVIVDLPAPGQPVGVGSGTVGLVAEFVDMTSAVAVDASGTVTTRCVPVECFSAQDMLNKVGGFDETLGEFGGSLGNGFQALRNKSFSRLVVCPVNLCSSLGVRYFRSLPLCVSVSNPAPVVPVSSATLVAGREFRTGAGRIRVGARAVFTGNGEITRQTGASTAAVGSAVTQTLTWAGQDWSLIVRPDGSLGARKGDILVIGNNVAGAFSVGAGTFRISADAVSGTTVTYERLDGAAFASLLNAATPFRLHLAGDADTAPERVPGSASPGGYGAADVGGYSIPSRPITNFTGANADGVWTAATVLTPAVTPVAQTGSSWDPLSGLGGRIMPSGVMNFTAAVQGINAPAAAAIDALYITGLAAFLGDAAPARDVNIIWCARKSATIRTGLKSHVLTASSVGIGREAILSPDLLVQTTNAAIALADPGVGANRDERVIYTWPGAVDFVPEAVGFRLKTADGLITIDGNLDESFDGWYASLLSNLKPECNPGQASAPVPQVFANVVGIQRGVTNLQMNDYIALKANGVSALRMDRAAGPIVQSGITTSLTSSQTNVNRRRFADFCQDSLAKNLLPFDKQVLTKQLQDAAIGEINAFCNDLLSPGNPAAQRIAQYQIDDVSGNTAAGLALGIFVIIVRIRMLPTADFIVIQAEVGASVKITAS